MIELSPLIILIAGEVLLVTTIATLVLGFLMMRQRRRDRSAVNKTIALIKKDDPRRTDETQQYLTEAMGLDAQTAEDAAQRFSHAERQFYQTVLNTYLHKDSLMLPNLKVEFESAVDPYRRLTPSISGVESSDSVQQVAVDNAEIKRLEEENARLSEELRITMDTMGRMLSEYSAMFAGGVDIKNGEGVMAEKLSAISGETTAAQSDKAKADDAQTTEAIVSEDEEILLDDVIEDNLVTASTPKIEASDSVAEVATDQDEIFPAEEHNEQDDNLEKDEQYANELPGTSSPAETSSTESGTSEDSPRSSDENELSIETHSAPQSVEQPPSPESVEMSDESVTVSEHVVDIDDDTPAERSSETKLHAVDDELFDLDEGAEDPLDFDDDLLK